MLAQQKEAWGLRFLVTLEICFLARVDQAGVLA
jgi:hypothetical protein